MPLYLYTPNICLEMFPKTVCHLTKTTLSPKNSQKHEINHIAGITEI